MSFKEIKFYLLELYDDWFKRKPTPTNPQNLASKHIFNNEEFFNYDVSPNLIYNKKIGLNDHFKVGQIYKFNRNYLFRHCFLDVEDVETRQGSLKLIYNIVPEQIFFLVTGETKKDEWSDSLITPMLYMNGQQTCYLLTHYTKCKDSVDDFEPIVKI